MDGAAAAPGLVHVSGTQEYCDRASLMDPSRGAYRAFGVHGPLVARAMMRGCLQTETRKHRRWPQGWYCVYATRKPPSVSDVSALRAALPGDNEDLAGACFCGLELCSAERRGILRCGAYLSAVRGADIVSRPP